MTHIKYIKQHLLALLVIPFAVSCTASLGTEDDSSGVNPGGTLSSKAMAIAMVNGEQDQVHVLEYDGNCLQEKSVLSEYVDNPRSMAIRSDKKEAIIAYGAVDKPSGLLVLELDTEVNEATVLQNVEFDFNALPNGIAYKDDDLAVVMGAVSQEDLMIPIVREGGGTFRVGEPTMVQDDYVVDAGNAGNVPLLLRGNPGSSDPVELWSLENDAESFSLSGQPVAFQGVHEMTSHPSLAMAYVAGTDPSEPWDSLDPKGFIHVVEANGGSANLTTTYQTPGEGTQIDISKDGSFLVTDVALGQLDSNGRPETRARTIQVVDLDQRGLPSGSTLVNAEVPMVLMHDLKIAPNENVVVTLELYQEESLPGEQNPVRVFSVNGSGMSPTCEDLHLGGQVKLEFVD